MVHIRQPKLFSSSFRYLNLKDLQPKTVDFNQLITSLSHTTILGLLFIVTISQSQGQQQSAIFTDVAIEQGIFHTYGITQLGNGMSFYDYDNDGWDDLTLSRPMFETMIYRNIEGSFFPITNIPSGLDTKSVLWCDLDNDGLNDLITCSKDLGLRIFKNIDNWTFESYGNFTNWSFDPNSQSWGIACSDINHDGLLDIYVCNYNQILPNLTFINQGNFTFELNQDYFSPQYTRHSFQGSFIQLNDDAIPDLYVINDFYQGNNFYVSNESGGFNEETETRNLAIPSDAMSNSWADFDHDGDWDVYITNRFEGNRLMINDGTGYFVDEASSRNCAIYRWCWSGLWVDYDNNGWEDLWVTNESLEDNNNVGNHLLKNENGYFTPTNLDGFSNIDGYTSAKGDFNNDGMPDIAYQPVSGSNFRLLKNQGVKDNNFIEITLHGVYSNHQAIGSVVEYHHQGEHVKIPIQIGENYLNQNSQHYILGIGLDTLMDSLIIHWPSGITEKHFALQSRESYDFHEGETLTLYEISMVDSCAAESGYIIEFHPDFNVYGSNAAIESIGNNSYLLHEEGTWDFLLGIFSTIQVPTSIHINEQYTPLTSVIMPTCANSQDGLISWYAPDQVWYNYMDSLNAGEYIVEVEFGQCVWSDTLQLIEQEVLILDSIIVQPAACATLNNGTIVPQYNTNAPSVTWVIGNSAENGNLSPGQYTLTLTSAAGCQVTDTVHVPLEIELPIFSEDSAHFCPSENLNYESFTEQWLFNEWTLTSWEINEEEDSIYINYMHPNGCPLIHPMKLIWIAEPMPLVDTLYTINENWVEWEVDLENNFDFNIYWEDGTDLWSNIHPCNDSTYFVLQYQNICAWTFPVATMCVESSTHEMQSENLEWLFCSNQLTNNSGYTGEIRVYNALGQCLYFGSASSDFTFEHLDQPRWVRSQEKIYPVRWCIKD